MENGIMTDFLEQHGSEANSKVFSEFNMAVAAANSIRNNCLH
jgi:hypothetical protein